MGSRREAEIADILADVKYVQDQTIAAVLEALEGEGVLRIDRVNRAIRITAPGSIDMDVFQHRVDQILGRA